VRGLRVKVSLSKGGKTTLTRAFARQRRYRTAFSSPLCDQNRVPTYARQRQSVVSPHFFKEGKQNPSVEITPTPCHTDPHDDSI